MPAPPLAPEAVRGRLPRAQDATSQKSHACLCVLNSRGLALLLCFAEDRVFAGGAVLIVRPVIAFGARTSISNDNL